MEIGVPFEKLVILLCPALEWSAERDVYGLRVPCRKLIRVSCESRKEEFGLFSLVFKGVETESTPQRLLELVTPNVC